MIWRGSEKEGEKGDLPRGARVFFPRPKLGITVSGSNRPKNARFGFSIKFWTKWCDLTREKSRGVRGSGERISKFWKNRTFRKSSLSNDHNYPQTHPRTANQEPKCSSAPGVTIGVSLVGGLLTGLIIKLPCIHEMDPEEYFRDSTDWEMNNLLNEENES